MFVVTDTVEAGKLLMNSVSSPADSDGDDLTCSHRLHQVTSVWPSVNCLCSASSSPKHMAASPQLLLTILVRSHISKVPKPIIQSRTFRGVARGAWGLGPLESQYKNVCPLEAQNMLV